MTRRELWEMICGGRGGGGGGVRKDINSMKTHVSLFFSLFCSLLGVFCTETTKKDGQLLNKPRTRLLLKNPGGTFLQIQTDIYTHSVILVI